MNFCYVDFTLRGRGGRVEEVLVSISILCCIVGGDGVHTRFYDKNVGGVWRYV